MALRSGTLRSVDQSECFYSESAVLYQLQRRGTSLRRPHGLLRSFVNVITGRAPYTMLYPETGVLSLFPAGSLACLTAGHLYILVILQPTRFCCPPSPRLGSTYPGSQFLWPRHHATPECDLALRHLLPILPHYLNHRFGISVNRLTPNHGLLG